VPEQFAAGRAHQREVAGAGAQRLEKAASCKPDPHNTTLHYSKSAFGEWISPIRCAQEGWLKLGAATSRDAGISTDS